MKNLFNSKWLIPFAIVLGVLAGMTHHHVMVISVELISAAFINVLKLMSLPLIFLSIVMTAFKFESLDAFKTIGGRVLKYTLLTTVIAASIALLLYLVLLPSTTETLAFTTQATSRHGFLDYLAKIMPSNIVQPFIEGNVLSVLLLAVIFSFGVLSVSNETKEPLKQVCTSLYEVVIKIVSGIITILPIGIFAFVAQFVHESAQLREFKHLLIYLVCIVLANLIQAIVVLPLLLKYKKIAPFALFKHMLPALSVAFFSKSSGAALPVALRCSQENAKISPEISNFSLPLCTTINMNACAAFILITVLFVSAHHGLHFSMAEYLAWIIIATVAAVGNAGVPMGCYFLATSLLAAMGVPLHLMAIILPVYSLIDMLESAINVWSDSCVTAIVDLDSQRCPSTQALLKRQLEQVSNA